MKTLTAMILVSLFAFVSQANSGLPSKMEVLMSAAGPTVIAELDAVEVAELKAGAACELIKAYTGKAQLRFGTQTYKLASVESMPQKMCATDTDFTKFDQVILNFVNEDKVFGNTLRLVLPKAGAPGATLVSSQQVRLNAKILE